jgi:tetratricopeptide (TPR) repeat protein
MGRQKYGEAEAAYRKAIALRPQSTEAHTNMGNALSGQRKHREAEAAYRKAIALKPDYVEAYYNLGNGLFVQGKRGEAEAAWRKAIDLKPAYPEAHFNLGLVLREQTQFDQAAAALKKAGDLFPAAHPRREEARQLQRQCERYMILAARFPAILLGKEKPANPVEQVEFARLCCLKKLHAAEARFYRNAFAADPKLAEDVPQATRYHAACAAVLAGCGQGKDADQIDDKERTLWRRQALEWLRKDVTWWSEALDNGNAQTRARLQQRLRHWQTDDDLAGLREPGALEALSPDERKEWLALWKEVAAMLIRAQSTR